MMEVLTKEVIASFKDAARKLTGPKRRAFEAQVTLDYLDGNIWKAEKVFGWSHHTVALGLNELRELRQLREENRKLKGIVADLTLDKHILQEVLSKKA